MKMATKSEMRASSTYQNLKKLYLERCGLSSEGVMILFNIDFSKLEELDLGTWAVR